jgi:glucosamine 6-phosphate synthetase-like amidotransferase/phosphosugar isomerase protein
MASSASWRETALWRETSEIPGTLERTLDDTPGIVAVADLIGAPDVRRVVATGNGAAYYAAMALWLASLGDRAGPEVLCVPAGLLAGGAFPWRPGDVLLAFSASGEMRDVIEALDAGAPTPFAAITASPESTIGSRADAIAVVTVGSQDAITHTQAFCGNVVAALSIWAAVTGDRSLATATRAIPTVVTAAVEAAQTWVGQLPDLQAPSAGIVFGTRHAWAGALEGALLLKEVSGIPAEGVETREGATSAMYPLRAGHIVVSLPTVGDTLLEEAEATCSARGATVVRAPGGDLADPRLSAVTAFPATVALAARLGVKAGLDIDRPAWTDAYYAVARGVA